MSTTKDTDVNIRAARIQLTLISHTNNGKTTLARTLLGRDVGEVRDAPDVTQAPESHVLISTAQGDALELWDTPGFGDSARLLKRLATSDHPVGWFLREVFDRYRDRRFWLSQQALRTARDSTDVVLYLVNSAEKPEDAGYLSPEMHILQWLNKPVLVLLNQMGPPRPAQEEQEELARWRRHLEAYSCVQRVLALDAFARCWVHERVFYETVGQLLGAAQKNGYARILATWQAGNETRFQASMRRTAQLLATAAQDSQAVEADHASWMKKALQATGVRNTGAPRRQDQAMQALVERLNKGIASTTGELLTLHRLDPGQAGKINTRVRENFVIHAPIDQTQAGLLGAVITGATTGLSADLMVGGLSFGAGALLGSIVGALTFAGAAWGFNAGTDRSQPSVQFSDDFLRTLLITNVLRYLAVAHFGRGRGQYSEGEAPAFWQAAVEGAVLAHDKPVASLWPALRAQRATDESAARAQALVLAITSRTLSQLYPSSPFTVDGRLESESGGRSVG